MNPHNDDDHRFTPSRSDVFVLSAIEAGKLFTLLFWLEAVGQSFCALCNRLTDWEPVDRFSRWLTWTLLLVVGLVSIWLMMAGLVDTQAKNIRFVDPMSAAVPKAYYETVRLRESGR